MPGPAQILSPRLLEWCRTANPGDEHVAVVSVGATADPAEVAKLLEGYGFSVTSAGPGAIVGSATPKTFNRLAEQRWVLAVEEPRGMVAG